MILFVLDQVAAAEYVTPLLEKWIATRRSDSTVLAAPKSAAWLAARGIPHETLAECGRDEARRWIDSIRPRYALLSTSVPNDLEHHFLRELAARGVPTAQLVDHWLSPRARFEETDAVGERRLVLPDRILTLDDDGRARLVAAGVPTERIDIIGQPYWEACWRKSQAESGTPDAERLGLMISQPIARHYGRSWGYDEKDFARCCIAGWEAAGLDTGRLHLLVHPAEDVGSWADVRDSAGRPVSIVPNATTRLSRYSLLMGMSSSMLAQGALAGIAAISVQPDAIGADQCVFSERGFIPRVISIDELTAFLCGAWRTSSAVAGERIGRVVDGSLARFEAWFERFTAAS